MAREKGASSWLCALTLQEHGFALHKSAFSDALALRYGWSPTNLPTSCSCGKGLFVEHAMSFPRGDFPTLRHKRSHCSTFDGDLFQCVGLQDLDGEVLSGASALRSDGARVGIAVDDFWGDRQRAFWMNGFCSF